MRDKHLPREEFVQRLESEIGREVRRLNASTTSTGWMPQWNLKRAVAAGALVLVSMAIGGAVVAVAYQTQDNERRDTLIGLYQRKLQVAQAQLALTQEELTRAQQRFSIGLGSEDTVAGGRFKVIEAESALRVIQLQIEEIRLTKQEPLSEVTSPPVSGRDFVTERWRIEIEVPKTALEAEQKRLAGAQRRVEIGVADPSETAASRARIVEIESGIQTFQRKIDIRQRFLKGEFDAAMADLRVQEAVAEQKQKALVPKVELAEQNADRIGSRVQKGLASQLEFSQAKLDLMQVRMEVAQAENDLAVIRQKIAQRGK